MTNLNMPHLVPRPIPTGSGLRWWNKAKIWLTQPRKFKLSQDWVFPFPFAGYTSSAGISVVIPKGFIFDGASIPKIFQSFLNPYGILLIPGLIHDFTYKNNYLICEPSNTNLVEDKPRKYWDKLFYEIAVSVNGMPIINKIAYYGIRLGGWVAWNRYRKTSDLLG